MWYEFIELPSHVGHIAQFRSVYKTYLNSSSLNTLSSGLLWLYFYIEIWFNLNVAEDLSQSRYYMPICHVKDFLSTSDTLTSILLSRIHILIMHYYYYFHYFSYNDLKASSLILIFVKKKCQKLYRLGALEPVSTLFYAILS